MKTVRNDPLIGKIYSTKDLKQISYQNLVDRAAEVNIIYLGENHDNQEHHDNQIRIIKDLIQKGKKPRIGFEFFSADQTGTLMNYVFGQRSPHQGIDEKSREARLRSSLGWDHRSDWSFYFQFIQLAYENHLPVFGTDLPAGIISRITRNGVEGLTALESTFLHPTSFKDDNYRQLMYGQFKDAHCGFAPQGMMEKLYQTWLARNDAMAFSIAKTYDDNPDQPIVMILGKGHVEYNMAVYDRVHFLKPGLRQFNLGFMEIAINPLNLEDYFKPVKSGNITYPPSFEYVWFTQRTSYEDPCERFREILEKMNHKKVTPKSTNTE